MDDPPAVTPSTTSPTDEQEDTAPDCPFCRITEQYPPIAPVASTSQLASVLDPEKLSPPTYVVLSTQHVVAFLDIAPLTRGHVLVAPRKHRVRIGNLSAVEMSEMGRVLPLLARSVIKAVFPDIPHDEADYNVVQNNGPGAAQVIPHVHFHMIPRPPLNYQPPTPVPSSSSTNERSKYSPSKLPTGLQASYIQFGRGMRSELDDDDAAVLVKDIRSFIRKEWCNEFQRGEQDPGNDLGKSRARSNGRSPGKL